MECDFYVYHGSGMCELDGLPILMDVTAEEIRDHSSRTCKLLGAVIFRDYVLRQENVF